LKPISTGKVKAKRIKSPRIVHHHDSSRRWQLLLLLLLLVAVGWQAYIWGVRQGGYDGEQSVAEIAALKRSLEEQQNEVRDLSAEVVRYKRQAEIEQQASRELQQQLIAVEDAKASLQSEAEMLRSLVSTGNGSLYVKNLELAPDVDQSGYVYKFTIVQVMEKVKTTRGKLVMKVSGKLKGKTKHLNQTEFSDSDEKAVKLEFSNYQDVAGTLKFPEGFVPKELVVEFLPRNKELKKMSKTFSWAEYLQDIN
jgi:cell division protein FtsB